MGIESLSDQTLLTYMILLGLGALGFAGVFVFTLALYVRNRRAANKRAPENTFKGATLPAVEESRGTMGSLLKSTTIKRQGAPLDAAAPADALAQIQPSPAKNVEYRELLRVLVDSSGEQIVVEVDGKRYEAISQVKDRTVGRRILETTAALLKFTGGYIAAAGGAKFLAAPKVKLTALPPEAAPRPSPPTAPPPSPTAAAAIEPAKAQDSGLSSQAQQFLADMEAATRGMQNKQEPAEKGSFWGKAFSRKEKSETPPTKISSFSLADEIDEIVQRKLQQVNERTQVKIHSGAGGMVRIQAAGRFYDSVDQIEDPDIQAIIKSAIEEWNG